MNSNYGSRILGWVFVIHIALTSQVSVNACNVNHEFIVGITCCKGNEIETTALQDTAAWTECVGEGTDANENYTTTMWRMYTCTLGKLLPKDQKTINLKEFAKLRISNFTESLQKKILAKIKKDVKDDSKKLWLSSDVQLTNYPNIDKIRKHYFDIEKDICGYNGTDPPWKNITAGFTKNSSCQMEEEMFHRGGDCCEDISLPLSVRKFQINGISNCHRTLKAQFDRITFKNKSKVDELELELQCMGSCYLVEKKLLTIDQLLKVKVNDTIDDTAGIVEEPLYPFLSKKVLKSTQEHVQEFLHTTEIWERVEEEWSNKIYNPADLYVCYLHKEILAIMHHALESSCSSEESNV